MVSAGPAAKRTARPTSPRRLILAAAIAAATVGLDQYSKHLARILLEGAPALRLAGGVLVLRFAENQGAFLSLGAGWPPWLRAAVFGLFSLLIVAGAAAYLVGNRGLGLTRSAALALVVGGGAGNLIDRLTRGGAVTDFLNLGVGRLRTGIFNLADLFLLSGVAVLLLARDRKGGRRLPPADGAGG